MTMTQLTAQITLEELQLWAAYFEIKDDQSKKEQRHR